MKTSLQKSHRPLNRFLFHWTLLISMIGMGNSFDASAQTYIPKSYWTFNGPVPTKDSMNTSNLDFTAYGCNYIINNGLVGKCLTLDNNPSLITAGNLNLDSAFTIEFLFKPGYKFNLSNLFGRLDDAVGGSMSEDHISFSTRTKTTSGSIIVDELRVDFTGIGRKSLGYYIDGNWHHMVFKYNALTGVKEIWVDAQRPPGFSKTVSQGLIDTPPGANKTFVFESTVYYVQYFGDIDEIAVYTKDIPSTLVYKHYLEGMAGTSYSFNNVSLTLPATSPTTAGIDINEYPVGHPNNITQTSIQQLRAFPMPRYKTGHTLKRNFNWIDPTYMSGWTQPNITYAQSVTNSVEIIYEMAKTWNYYLVATANTSGYQYYNDTTKQPGAWVKLCNQNPQIPCSAITLWPQTNPTHIGRASSVPYIWSLNLPANHYLRNANGNYIDPNGNVTTNKYWSPTRPQDSIYYDGQTQRFYLSQLLNSLTRPLDIINENAEVIPLLQPSAMSQDPSVLADKNASGLDWATYFGNRKEKASSFYKNQFMSLPALANTIYSEYSIDGQQDWRPKYSEARKTNTPINGQYYSTPDFYPRYPNNWRYWQSAWHGWQWIVDCRKNELAVGDKLYSPFVAAGWDNNEENNIRPAQWLGLLKALGMSGAEFYYSAFFNLNFPMSNPANYTWQAAMPSYAQAITSRYEDILRNGYLMDGDVGNTTINPTAPGYAFRTGDLRKLVVIRKHNNFNKYAITGTIQPNNNMIGGAELESTAKITLSGQTLKFKVRRQGSTYMYDNTNPASPVFYQLDEWHEASHPSRWSQDFTIEGELYENSNPAFVIKTAVPSGTVAGDFTNFTSYTTYNDTSTVFNPMSYTFSPRMANNNTYYLWVRARSRSGAPTGVSITVDGGIAKTLGCISDTAWNWYRFDACSQQAIQFASLTLQSHTISFAPSNAKFELDKFMLTTNSNLILNPAPASCSAGVATVSTNGPTTFCQGGSVVMTASSGQSYLWTNGLTTQSITVTSGGSYSVAVGQAGGCSASSAPITVSVSNPTASVTVNGPTVFCQGGSVQLTASAGASYIWTNGATTQIINATTSGNYGVKITNANGCSANSPNQTVTVNTAPSSTITANGPLNFCQGGSVTLTAASGTSYLWTPGGQTTQTINVTSSGSYGVKVTNSGGCSTISQPAVVNVTSTPVATITAGGNTSNVCPGTTVQLTASSGQSYSWSNGATTQSINVSSAGSYAVNVNMGGGCLATSSPTSVTYSSNPSATIAASGPVSFCQGGNVTLTASNGSGYLWLPGGQTTPSIQVTSSGNYSVRVTNASGCSATSSPTAVNVSSNPVATISASGSTSNLCPGNSVQLTASSGQGYSWSNGATTQSIQATAAGNYVVSVNMGNGCSATSSPTAVTFSSNPAASISANGPLSFCQGGSVALTASQGTSYVWSDGSTSQSLIASTSGNYIVTVSSAYGCTSVAPGVTVAANATVNATITASGPTTFCQGGSVTFTANQASSYYWYPDGQTTQAITVNSPGFYYVQVTVGGGCTATSAIKQVKVNSTPSAVITASGPTTITQGQSVTLSCSSADGYLWSPGGQITQSITVHDTGYYSVTAFSQNGCAANSSTIHVTYATATAVITPSGPTNFCQGDVVMLTASAGSAYLWSNGQITKSITVSTGGTYMVTVTNANGSTSTASQLVTVNSKPLEPTMAISYIPNSAYQLTAYEPSALSYQWSNGSTAQTIVVSSPGNYTVKAINGFGCSTNSQLMNVSAVTPKSCVATNMLTAYNILDTSVTLEWNPAITGNLFKIIYYEKGSINFQAKTVSGTSFKMDLTGLLPGKTYRWFVQTICSNASYYSSVAYFNTLDGPLNCGSTPQNPVTVNIKAKAAELKWYPTSADEFTVRYREVGANTYKTKTVNAAVYQQSGIRIYGLTPSTVYEWSVQSLCNSVSSLYSKTVTFITHDACPQPVNIYHSAVTNKTVTLHWDASNPADTMRIRYYEKGTMNYHNVFVACNPVNPGYFILNNLKPATSYVYSVKGKCAWGGSDFSNEIEFNTLGNPNIPISTNPDDDLKLLGYPNPATTLFNYGFITNEEGAYTVKICDMMGRVIMSEESTANKGINGGSLNVEKMANGLYTLVLQKKAQVSRFRFSVH